MDIRHRQRRRWNHIGRYQRGAKSRGAQSPDARPLAVERLESRALLSAVAFTGNYSQDFDSLPIAGTSFFYGGVTSFDARPIEAAAMGGWQLHKSSGSGDFVTFMADNGHAASSSVRSFGEFDMPDRALGSIANQLGGYAYGVTLTNDTGGTLTSITLSFTGEQWQESGALAAQALRFEFAVGEGASLDQGTFVGAPELDFTAPQHGGTARTLDGNAAANRTALTATITGLSWAPGEELVLRWTDSDDADADHGLGIDDLTVTAAPLNLSAPIFTAGAAQTLEIPENSPNGTILGVAEATDPDLPVEPLTYSIIAGAPVGAFAIDANGQLTIFDAALVDLDFENGAEVAVLTIQVSDGLHTSEQTVTLNVLPINDNLPQFVSGASQVLSIDENSATGTIVGQASATDADLPAETLAYSITAGDALGAFAIDANGQLTIVDAALVDLDFENGAEVAVLTIQVSDGLHTSEQTVTLNVLPINDNLPQFVSGASQVLSIDENSATGTIVGQASATDADLSAETLAYSITAGDALGAFAIDANGQLTIVDAALVDLDFENGAEVAVLTIQVSDGLHTSEQTVTLNVLPINDNLPQFVSGASQVLSIDENSATGTIVGQASATDADLPAETLAYSITAGDALGAFAIDANGQLTIVDAALVDLDFENGAEVAVLTIQVSDGLHTSEQTVTLNVLPINDNLPQFTSAASLAVDENVVNVATLTAIDADFPEQAITFTIVGGEDAALFFIANGNELTLLAGLDFESATDADANGVYLVDVEAADGAGGTTTLPLSITVADVDETPPPLTALSSGASTWWLAAAVATPNFLTPAYELPPADVSLATSGHASSAVIEAGTPGADLPIVAAEQDDSRLAPSAHSLDIAFEEVESWAAVIDAALVA